MRDINELRWKSKYVEKAKFVPALSTKQKVGQKVPYRFTHAFVYSVGPYWNLVHQELGSAHNYHGGKLWSATPRVVCRTRQPIQAPYAGS
jgi:hypothetical protein